MYVGICNKNKMNMNEIPLRISYTNTVMEEENDKIMLCKMLE